MKTTMKLLLKFLSLSLEDRYLVLEAACWLGISQLTILTLPFKWLAPFLGQHMGESPLGKIGGKSEVALRIAWAVTTMSRYLPWECKCLAQATGAKMMLRRRRLPGTLYLGVAKTRDQGLIAHAWLRCGDMILTGRYGMERFKVVSTFA